jgi:hypothetical protein
LNFAENGFLSAFFKEYLGRLHVDGRIFWIFDSFDEIPAILDVHHSETLIRVISNVISRFARQGGTEGNGSRAVISSRYHRRPVLPADIATRLDIRPFGEDKIVEALNRVRDFPRSLITSLLSQRQDLIPLARTPFYLGLIAEFGLRYRRLPHTQVELFEAHVLSRVGSDQMKIQYLRDADTVNVIRLAEDIAHFLFSSERYGLESPIDELRAAFPLVDVGRMIERLKDARLLRVGRPPQQICSFSHRRIQEYFVIRHMIREGEEFDHEWVALDSRMRDAAVLYVELASEEKAESIAHRCWLDIEKVPPAVIDYGNARFWRALHCQRFLAEAFRARLRALESFRNQMAERALTTLEQTKDLITAKLAVETVGLLPEDKIPDALAVSLGHGDAWIRESAVNASRFLPKVRPDLAGRIWRSIASMEDEDFSREQTRLSYAFQLSSGFMEVAKLIEQRSWDNINWHRHGKWIAGIARFWHLIPYWFWREIFRGWPLDNKRAGSITAPLSGASGDDLTKLEWDKTSGLRGYRRVLATTRRWRLGATALFLILIGLIAMDIWSSIGFFGLPYLFAALVYRVMALWQYAIIITFVFAGLIVSPYFAERSYPLVVPGEAIGPRGWGEIGEVIRFILSISPFALFGFGVAWLDNSEMLEDWPTWKAAIQYLQLALPWAGGLFIGSSGKRVDDFRGL